MESQHAKHGREAAEIGIEALQRKRRDEAATYFDKALDHFEAIEDDAERCSELGKFAVFLDEVGFHDLSLMAAQEAVKLDEQLNDTWHKAGDLITCGNAQLHMGNYDEALSLFRQSLELCIEIGHLANAASASTNIALIIGNLGKMDEAIRMMYQSLDYLTQKPAPATEIITRIALTQALESENRPPEEVFAVARPLARFAQKLRPDQWDGLRDPLEQTVQRYLLRHPDANPLAVKMEYLAGLF